MIYLVSIGAIISTIDLASDAFILSTYYGRGLSLQANMMLGMIFTNLFIQLFLVFVQYQKKNWTVKAKEALICILCLRPVVDAYRISVSHEDKDLKFDTLTVMIVNKVSVCVGHYYNMLEKRNKLI